MIFSFDYLKNAVDLKENGIVTLSIENKTVFRNIVGAFKSGELEENGIVFSENYQPIDCKKYVCFIDDFFNPEFPSAFLKKLYTDAAQCCHNELLDETLKFKSAYEVLMSGIICKFDYDLTCNYDFDLAAFLKFRGLCPALTGEGLLENLLEYILLISKYSAVKCFVALNLHLFFMREELGKLFEELNMNHISMLVIEGALPEAYPKNQKIYILDEDLCEISD